MIFEKHTELSKSKALTAMFHETFSNMRICSLYSIEKRHDRMSCAIYLDVGSKGQYETFLETLLRATSVAV